MHSKILMTLVFAALIIAGQSKILYTLAVVRHGAEYPRNDLYDGNQTKAFRGQITPIGLRQHYNLGSYFLHNYITTEGLVTPKYNPNSVQFYCTSYQRTQQSALAFAYGFYPLGSGWTIPEEVTSDKFDPPFTSLSTPNLQQLQVDEAFGLDKGYQPLPIRALDSILNNCPNYDQLVAIRKRQIAPQVEKLQVQLKAQISKLRTVFNLTSQQESAETLCELFQTIYSDQYLGRVLPKDYNSTDNTNLQFIYNYYNSLLFDGSFAKVISTPLLRTIRSKLENTIKGKTLKFSLMVGHRSNLLPLAILLNLTDAECIRQKWKRETVTSLNCVSAQQFAANLAIELHEDDTFLHFVRIKYNGEYVFVCNKKDTKCRYEEFAAWLKDKEVDYDSQCGVNEDMIVSEQ